LEALCKRLHGDFIEKQIGQTRTVLFESSDKNGFMYGFTENYIKIKAPYDARLVNRMVSMRINKENICHEGEEA
jgi:threonylcarbamoyladenosine tRNA methylthiotransferase MtaB